MSDGTTFEQSFEGNAMPSLRLETDILAMDTQESVATVAVCLP